MAGHFKISAITDLNEAKLGTELSESDYATLTPQGKFVQLSYIEQSKEAEPYKVEPGIFTIMKKMTGFHLEKTSFTKDNILEDFVNTQEIENKADCFFRNISKYKEMGFEIAKRNMLLYGPPGTGKSTAISKICQKYFNEGKTAIITFATEKFEAYEVKDFIKTFEYVGVDRLILIMEDIGGSEMEEVRRAADSGLLSLLDNNEKTLKIPTLILATTNFPEALMGMLTNRPGRFDDKIKAGYPEAEARTKLMSFFAKRDLNELELMVLKMKTAEELSPAHLKEAYVRSVIHEKTLDVALKEVIKEVETYKKAFNDKGKSLGL